MHCILYFLIGITAYLHTVTLCAQKREDFTLVKKQGTTALYERWITYPGSNPPMKSREMKAEFYYHNTIYAGLHLLKDESRAMNWQSHLAEYKLFLHKDTTVWQEYSYHDIPWPVTDQDHLLEFRLTMPRPNSLYITFKSIHNDKLMPLKEDAMRMELAGSWLFEQLSPKRVRVTYKVRSKPIDVPRIFTDPIVRSNFMTTLEQYIAQLEK
jgi:hypothetical protein